MASGSQGQAWLSALLAGGKSGSRNGSNVVPAVAAIEFDVEVDLPVGLEVATCVQGAQPQNALGPAETPRRSGEVHAVLDQMTAGTLDHAAGWVGQPPSTRRSGRMWPASEQMPA